MTEPKKEKCEACCGSGYINFWTDDGHISMRTCRRCDGYGYIKVVPMTNEEYLKSCTTEQLAEWFGDWHSFSCVFCKHWQNGCIYNHNQVRCAIEEGKSNKELWVEWLKQPHTIKE